MSSFIGTTGGPMNASFGATVFQDQSWTRYARRAKVVMNPWADMGPYARPRHRWGRAWTRSAMMCGDPSVGGYAHMGNEACEGGSWAPILIAGSNGNGTHKFIIGQAKDSGGSGISGATIQCFLTSTDELVSSTGSDSSGNFMAPTPNTGVNHYLRGTGSGVAGATVNTLTPTNADGT